MRGNVHKVTLTPHNAALLHHKAALFQYNVRLLADVFLKLTACHKGARRWRDMSVYIINGSAHKIVFISHTY